MFETDLLNTCWVEDVYKLLKKKSLRGFKEKLEDIYNQFLECGGYCDMGIDKLNDYVLKNKENILKKYQNYF